MFSLKRKEKYPTERPDPDNVMHFYVTQALFYELFRFEDISAGYSFKSTTVQTVSN